MGLCVISETPLLVFRLCSGVQNKPVLSDLPMHSNLTPNWPIGLKRLGLYPIDYTLSRKCVLGSPPLDICRQ